MVDFVSVVNVGLNMDVMDRLNFAEEQRDLLCTCQRRKKIALKFLISIKRMTSL